MTPHEFGEACAALGVRLVPAPDGATEAQHRCPEDSAQRASVTMAEGMILAEWARGLFVLEIGTGLGVSTACIASTAEFVLTVDPDPWVLNNVNLPPNVSRSLKLPPDPRPFFHMAFIDGEHDFASVGRDIAEASRRVRPGGWLVFHDYGQLEVRRAIDAMLPESDREVSSTVGPLMRTPLLRVAA